MAISYEKVLEVDTFPFELLGETKVEESLRRVLKSIRYYFKDYGRVFLEIGEPINMKKYLIE